MIKFKGYEISYQEIDDYFKDMKMNRYEREKELEEIAITHKDLLLEYNKNKPPIDDISLNTFQFKEFKEIKNDLCYNNLNGNINYSCNNALFHLLNNIIAKQKEEKLIKRIDELKKTTEYIYLLILALFINFYWLY